jgi:hypothetical protein
MQRNPGPPWARIGIYTDPPRKFGGRFASCRAAGAAHGEVALYCKQRAHLHFEDAMVNLPSTGRVPV